MILRLKQFIILSITLFHSTLAVVPTFDRQNENVTVIIGNSVVLPCFISNLGDHKVSQNFLFCLELLPDEWFYNTSNK